MSSPKTLNQWVETYTNFDFEADQIENSKCPSWDNACKELKSILKKQAQKFDLTVENFHSNWYECSWFLKNKDNKFVYCHISDVRHWDDAFTNVLIRTAEHDHDWTGGSNNYCVLSTADAKDYSYNYKHIFPKACELLGMTIKPSHSR